ncbi:MAG: hypothetical protein ACFFCS_26120 [Candidatus Hodarchaeota archaeon]
MSEIEKLNELGRENMLLAEGELAAAKQLKKVAKSQVKKAKARKGLMDAELDIAKVREDLAVNLKKVTKKKEKLTSDGLLEVAGEVLKNEQKDAEYNEKIAKIQKKAAKANEKIAKQDVALSEESKKLANLITQAAKARKLLGKKQLSYVNSKKNDAPEEKITTAMNSYLEQRKKLQGIQKNIVAQKGLIRDKENQLGDMRKELSSILSELEKIRHE